MSDIGKQALKTKINSKVYENSSQAITGAAMNEVLQDMVDTLCDGANLDAGSVTDSRLQNPVSVSQNSETGHTEIHIGSDDYPVASVGDANKLQQEIKSSQNLIDDLNKLISANQDDKFIISDKNGYVVGYFDYLGLHTIDVFDKDGESLYIAAQSAKQLSEIISSFKEDEYLVTDSNGYIIAKINSDGLKTIVVNDKQGSIGHNILKGYQLITIGDSLCAGNDWQSFLCDLLGCNFNSQANIKAGEMISTGGTQTYGGTKDSAFFRVLNLYKQGIISNDGDKTIIILENVNDFYGVGASKGTVDDLPMVPTEPIETEQDESNFNSTYLNSIKSEYGAINAILSFDRISAGKLLTITSLPTIEGDITLVVGRSNGGGSNSYNVHVVPQATDAETLAYVVDKILEYNYAFVSDAKGAEDNEIVFTSGNTSYPAFVTFTDTDNTGMAVTITDTNNAKLSILKFFVGTSLDDWADTSKWKDGSYLTLYRAWKSCIQFVLEKFPKAKIFIGGFPALSMNPNNYKMANGTYDHSGYFATSRYIAFESLYAIFKELADYYNIPYLDVAKNFGVDVSNYSTYYNNDNVHPKPIGYKRIAECLAGLIKNYVQN